MPISEQITQYEIEELGLALINSNTDTFFPLNGMDTRHFDRAVTVILSAPNYTSGSYVMTLQHADVQQAASFVDIPALSIVHPGGLITDDPTSIAVAALGVYARLAPYSTLSFIRAKVTSTGVTGDNGVLVTADKWPDTRPKKS